MKILHKVSRQTSPRRTGRLLVTAGSIVFLAVLATIVFSDQTVRYRLLNNDLVYSQSAALSETWHKFTLHNVEFGSGRTLVDHTSNITTSSSQGVTLLRAVWVDDKATFDSVWHWTATYAMNTNGLPASSYGPRADKSYGIINTSSDSTADQDTALALLMAYRRWGDEKYLNEAKPLIAAIYDHDVTLVNGSPVMMPGDDYAKGSIYTVSPGSFNVAAMREFAKVDPSHDWTGLVENSYRLLPLIITADGHRLPDYASVDSLARVSVDDRGFGNKGARAVFNLGLDAKWYGDGRDMSLLKSLTSLDAQYASIGTVVPSSGNQSGAFDGKVFSYFDVTESPYAAAAYKTLVLNNYDQDKQEWHGQLGFYDDTWIWLAIALHQNALGHLTEQ